MLHIQELRTSYGYLPIKNDMNIAMFHIGRCGSTVISDMLNQRPDIYWDGEIYEPVNKLWDSETDFIDFLKYRVSLSPKFHYGFEIKFYHLRQIGCSLRAFLSILDDLNFNIILLKRRNYLKKVVSSLIARVSGRWHIGSHESVKKEIINIDPCNVSIDHNSKSLLDLLNEYDNDIKFLENNSLINVNMVYEDDVADDPSKGYKTICRKFALSDFPAEIKFSKTTPFLIKDVVSNYVELNKYLSGSKFEWMTKE